MFFKSFAGGSSLHLADEPAFPARARSDLAPIADYKGRSAQWCS